MTDRIIKNKLISEFMGLVVSDVEHKRPIGYGWCSAAKLNYHSDWNWLMLAVKKCHTISSKKQVELKDIKDDLDNPNGWRAWSYRYITFNTDIERVYKSVIRYIEFYNSSL